jgi:hypothetical protein
VCAIFGSPTSTPCLLIFISSVKNTQNDSPEAGDEACCPFEDAADCGVGWICPCKQDQSGKITYSLIIRKLWIKLVSEFRRNVSALLYDDFVFFYRNFIFNLIS